MVHDWKAISENPRLQPHQKAFIAKMGPVIEEALVKTGSDLPVEGVLAQVALESGWGGSDLAAKHNNYGGIKDFPNDDWNGPSVAISSYEKNRTVKEVSNFRVYGSPEEYAIDKVKFLDKSRYTQVHGTTTPFDYALELGKAGYHDDDDFGYAQQVTSIAGSIFPDKDGEYKGAMLASAKSGRTTAPRNPEVREASSRGERTAITSFQPDEADKKYRKTEMDAWLGTLSAEDRAIFTGIMALILYAMGDTAGASALLEGASPSVTQGNYDQYEPALSSTGTGGRRYNPTTQEYDGENAPSSAKVLGNYSKIVDPSQLPSSDSTLKSGSIGSLRDKIKVEYTSRLDPYLFKGDVSDIPANTPVVVLDLGHLGKGSDLGAGRMTANGYLCEASSCMESNIAMAQKLSAQGVIVLSTTQSPRFENNTLSPSARQQFTQAVANEVGKDNIFFVSTHFNDAASSTVSGASMYLDKKNPDSVAYAAEMQGALEKSGAFNRFGQGVLDETATQHTGLSVTTKTYPSVLAELGFCKGDGDKLSNKAYMQKVGETLADAVTNVGTQRFAWNLKEKDAEIVKTTPEAPTPAPQPTETTQVGKGDGSMLRVKADDKPDFADLIKGVPTPNMVAAPKPTDETVSIEAAKKLTAGLELKSQKVDGWPPAPDASVAVATDPTVAATPVRPA